MTDIADRIKAWRNVLATFESDWDSSEPFRDALKRCLREAAYECERLSEILLLDASPEVKRAMLTFKRHLNILDDLKKARERVEKLEAALREYADATNWLVCDEHEVPGEHHLHFYGGPDGALELARQALAEGKG